MTEGKEVLGFEGSRFVGMKTSSKEESISDQVVVEVVVDEVPQLAGDVPCCEGHDGAGSGGDTRGDNGSK
jgi:hypothetical protein